MSDPGDLVSEIESLEEKLAQARSSITKRFIGQETVVDLTLTALLCGGHALLIGLPGLGKTRLVETLSTVMGLDGNRIQFTPDLMPADILGSEVLDTAADGSRSFRFIPGPVFCQLLMADEINRASPRTQSALLQAMQEKTVTVAGENRSLGAPFHVLATQNPIEQEGTYPLPEAQLDRFLVKIDVAYPDRDTERGILYRQPVGRRQTKKRAPEARLPRPFVATVRRWRAAGDRYVVQTYRGERVADIRKGWARAKILAGELAAKKGVHIDLSDVTPHTLRHTAITWALQGGARLWDVASYFGASAQTIERTYGPHSPHHQETAVRALEKGNHR
jgi:MoxR-like ATPase